MTLMTLSIPLKVVLVFSGCVLAVLGVQHLFLAVPTYTKFSTNLKEHLNLLNVVRSHIGATFIGVGGLIVLGAFIERLSLTAVILAPLFMAGIGLGRIYSLIVDGRPATPVTGSIIAEAVLTILLLTFTFFSLKGS